MEALLYKERIGKPKDNEYLERIVQIIPKAFFVLIISLFGIDKAVTREYNVIANENYYQLEYITLPFTE